MFYKVKVKDFIRVPPSMFDKGRDEAILANVKSTYENFVSKELGFVINVSWIGKSIGPCCKHFYILLARKD